LYQLPNGIWNGTWHAAVVKQLSKQIKQTQNPTPLVQVLQGAPRNKKKKATCLPIRDACPFLFFWGIF
jgi:hypothetical protein